MAALHPNFVAEHAMSAPYPDQAIFTVSQLNERARQLLEISFANIRVEGEISGLSQPSSGHWYFTLKDNQAQVRCAMFRNRTALLKFQPRNGDKVELRAHVSLYEARGDYQLIVETMKPAGEGSLLLAFEALKQKLANEGLFNQDNKRPLPRVRRVGVITSASGAALHDILTVLARRSPDIEVDVYPTLVQGKEAPAQIMAAIQRANRDQRVDVLIIGRGGGSLEDLWCFNDEGVARAIFQSAIPTVSAVGHEVDFTIADFVADLRAPTPSAAAELISTDRQQRLQRLQQLTQRLYLAQRGRLQHQRQQLARLHASLRSPLHRIQNQAQRLDHLEQRLLSAVVSRIQNLQWQLQQRQQTLTLLHPQQHLHRLQEHNQRLQQRLHGALRQRLQQWQWQLQQHQRTLTQHNPQQRLARMHEHTTQLQQRLQRAITLKLQREQQRLARDASLLNSVSPLQVLARGYAICEDDQGNLIRNYQQVQPHQNIRTRLHNGWISSQVIASGQHDTDTR